jgi:hypothetical protein
MDMLMSMLVGMALTHSMPVCMAMFMSVLMRTFHNSSLVQFQMPTIDVRFELCRTVSPHVSTANSPFVCSL